MKLGQNIERLRRARNWSLEDLAAAMEESPRAVSSWEKGVSHS